MESHQQEKKKLSFPKSKIKIVLLENCHSVAIEMFKKEGFNIEIHKGMCFEICLYFCFC